MHTILKKKTYIFFICVLFIFIIGIQSFQLLQYKKQFAEYPSDIPISYNTPQTIMFSNANSRETYFTIHNVIEAQKISKGKGIKVGIIDSNFAYEKHRDLYTSYHNFNSSAGVQEHHGYWMAKVLREIAPECKIYPLNVSLDTNEEIKVQNMVQAINWAVENKIDILTYSGPEISRKNRKALDDAVNNAVKKGIVTTFINYDNPNNIYPQCMLPLFSRPNSRTPDINIFRYDYNTLFTKQYVDFILAKKPPISGDGVPFLSYSSTSPVTAGFVAILKAINKNLSSKEYKDILIKTSYDKDYYDDNFKQTYNCSRVVDIEKAAKYLVNLK